MARELGDIEKIRIRHDNSGLFSGWYLEDIRISLRDTRKRWYFPCGNWLDEKQEDVQNERVLEAVPESEQKEAGGAEE